MILCQVLIMSGESSPTEYLKEKSANTTFEIILAFVK